MHVYVKDLFFIPFLKILLGIALILNLCGCGQDGPLYLPPPKPEIIEPCQAKTEKPTKPEHENPGNAKETESALEPSPSEPSKNPENPNSAIKTPKAD